jgi:hypothetical protein
MAAAITVPTPRGDITLNWTRSSAEHTVPAVTLSMQVVLPHGTSASLCMPLFAADPTSVTLALDGTVTRPRLEDGGAYACVDGVQQRANLSSRVLVTTVVPEPQHRHNHKPPRP